MGKELLFISFEASIRIPHPDVKSTRVDFIRFLEKCPEYANRITTKQIGDLAEETQSRYSIIKHHEEILAKVPERNHRDRLAAYLKYIADVKKMNLDHRCTQLLYERLVTSSQFSSKFNEFGSNYTASDDSANLNF